MHLVRGKMDKAKQSFFGGTAARQIFARGLKHHEGSRHIGVEKWRRLVDRTVHMGFRGKVNDGNGPMLFQKLFHQPGIRNVPHHHLASSRLLLPFQIRPVAGIGKFVQNHGLRLRLHPQQVPDVVRTDESTPPGDQNSLAHPPRISASTLADHPASFPWRSFPSGRIPSSRAGKFLGSIPFPCPLKKTPSPPAPHPRVSRRSP